MPALSIGRVDIENPVIVAPLAGISTMAFRSIAKEFHAGLVCNEMVSDKRCIMDRVVRKICASAIPMSIH